MSWLDFTGLNPFGGWLKKSVSAEQVYYKILQSGEYIKDKLSWSSPTIVNK